MTLTVNRKQENFGLRLRGPALQQGKAAVEQRHKDPELHKGQNRQIYGTVLDYFQMKGAHGRASHSSDEHIPPYCYKIPTSNPVVIRGLLFRSGLMMSLGQ